jgi:sporulation protein YlmC with PRC-barrel domain
MNARMHRFPVLWMRCLLLCGVGVFLQASAAPPDPTDASAGSGERASKLVGRIIEAENGWRVARLEDLVIDPLQGGIVFAVIQPGSRFRAPSSPLALKMPADQLKSDGRRLQTDLASDKLDRLPRLEYVLDDLDADVKARLCEARELLDADLRGPGGEVLGTVEDLIVDLASARVRFAVVNFAPSRFEEGKLVAVQGLRVADGNCAELLVDREQLSAAPAFRDPRFPNLHDDGFLDRIRRLWRST